MLGVADKASSVEPVKITNLIVTNGDPLEITTHLHALFISGGPARLENVHMRMYLSYMQRIPGGTPSSAQHNAAVVKAMSG